MSFERLPGSALNTSSRPGSSDMSVSSKSGVTSSMSMLRVVRRAKMGDFYIETQTGLSQSEARIIPFAHGVIATQDLTNQSRCFL